MLIRGEIIEGGDEEESIKVSIERTRGHQEGATGRTEELGGPDELEGLGGEGDNVVLFHELFQFAVLLEAEIDISKTKNSISKPGH